MDLATADSMVTLFSRNAGDTTYYTSSMVRFAWLAAADELVRRVGIAPRTDSIAIAPAAASVDVSGITGFRPDRFAGAFLSGTNVKVSLGQPKWNASAFVEAGPVNTIGSNNPSSATLDLVDHAGLLDRQIGAPLTGQPQALAFVDLNTAILYPVADVAYFLNIRWFEYIIAADGTTINLPDDLLRPVLMWGAPAFLQHNDPEHAFATESGKKFKDYIDSLIGSAGGTQAASVLPTRRRR